jgi:hypothetical protein
VFHGAVRQPRQGPQSPPASNRLMHAWACSSL